MLLLIIAGSARGAELLVNGGFENGTTGWAKWGTNAFVVSDSVYYKGSASAVMYWADSGFYQTLPAQAGDSFTLSGEMIYPGSTQLSARNAYIKIEFRNSTSLITFTEIGILTPSHNADQWYSFSGTVIAPAGTTQARVVVLTYDPGGTGSGKAYFDNISLTNVPSAPSISGPDYNRDQIINFADFASLAGAWLQNSTTYDLDGDGFVGISDLKVLTNAWLAAIPNYPGYEFVWSDEFHSPVINYQNWTHQIMGDGGNDEWQYYTNRLVNSWVEDGALILQAKKEDYFAEGKTFHYTSARLWTAGKQDFLYGKMEARIKVPKGQGIWAAFWMMPTDSVYGGWAASGEIDIMETINQAGTIYGTIHYGGVWPANTSSGGSYTQGATDFSQDFHIYSIEWEPTAMRWYVDGILYSTKTSWWSSGGVYPAPFNQRFHFLLNIAVGGNWPGYPDGTTVFPQKMLVDWVRVYQKN